MSTWYIVGNEKLCPNIIGVLNYDRGFIIFSYTVMHTVAFKIKLAIYVMQVTW